MSGDPARIARGEKGPVDPFQPRTPRHACRGRAEPRQTCRGRANYAVNPLTPCPPSPRQGAKLTAPEPTGHLGCAARRARPVGAVRARSALLLANLTGAAGVYGAIKRTLRLASLQRATRSCQIYKFKDFQVDAIGFNLAKSHKNDIDFSLLFDQFFANLIKEVNSKALLRLIKKERAMDGNMAIVFAFLESSNQFVEPTLGCRLVGLQ